VTGYQTSAQAATRRGAEYGTRSLDEAEAHADPLRQFAAWFEDAVAAEPAGGGGEANAMTLATADANARPSARIVLLRGYDERGFVFFTNHESNKGRDLVANPLAALVFHWPLLQRQVRLAGRVTEVAREESEEYWRSRPRGSQLGAWASEQSSVIQGRAVLDERLDALSKAHEDREVPLPSFWGGWRVVPQEIEFWQGRPNRLHDRLRYRLTREDRWVMERLAP